MNDTNDLPSRDTGEHPIYEPKTPRRVTLGEVYRGQQRLERHFSRLDKKLEEIFEQNIPSRVESLEDWRDWAVRIVVGAVTVGLLALLFSTGGTVA